MSYSATYDSITAQIEKTESNIERLEARLAKQYECPLTPRRRARIARIEKQLGFADARLVDLQDQLVNYENPPAEDQPSDAMEVNFRTDPVTGQNIGFEVSITDTGLDNTYIGGTDLKVQVRGGGYYTGRGWRSFRTTYGGLISGEWAPVDDTQTVSFSMFGKAPLENYPDMVVETLDGDNNIVFSQIVFQNGEVLI